MKEWRAKIIKVVRDKGNTVMGELILILMSTMQTRPWIFFLILLEDMSEILLLCYALSLLYCIMKPGCLLRGALFLGSFDCTVDVTFTFFFPDFIF